MGAEKWPAWLAELDDFLIVYPQFIFAGNINDRYLVRDGAGLRILEFEQAIWARLKRLGFKALLAFDVVDRLRVVEGAAEPAVAAILGQSPSPSGLPHLSIAALPDIVTNIANAEARMALLLYGSRLREASYAQDPQIARLFAVCEKLSYVVDPITDPSGRGRRYNPVIWVVDRVNDLPSWLPNNHRIRTTLLPKPDLSDRQTAAGEEIARWFREERSADETSKAAEVFAAATDGLPLRSLIAIAELATARGLRFADIGRAVQLFKLGVSENPWSRPVLQQRIAEAEPRIGEQVKGQSQAVQKTADILRRSVLGLTGAHVSAAAAAGRPKGILFLVGPTGVGKTELAKAISDLIFGDAGAILRFDMSEFSSEYAQARLIGAPPGYIGHDAGGELTDGIRAKPFSVVLFDEIEKAHPRLLDKFLQILEDGRLTDGHGETAYFSEAVIVFTSNLGTYVDTSWEGQGAARPIANINTKMSFSVLENILRNAVVEHFKTRIGRPEILNRIGDNIIVFDFIRDDTARLIFDQMMGNVVRRVKDRRGLDLRLAEPARAELLRLCTQNLENGGRGIGNRLETHFINPLSRALYNRSFESGEVEVTAIRDKDGLHEISLR